MFFQSAELSSWTFSKGQGSKSGRGRQSPAISAQLGPKELVDARDRLGCAHSSKTHPFLCPHNAGQKYDGNGDVARHTSRNIRPPSGPTNTCHSCEANNVSSGLGGPDLVTVGVPAGSCGKGGPDCG